MYYKIVLRTQYIFFLKEKIHCGYKDGVWISEPVENENVIQFLISDKYVYGNE